MEETTPQHQMAEQMDPNYFFVLAIATTLQTENFLTSLQSAPTCEMFHWSNIKGELQEHTARKDVISEQQEKFNTKNW